MHTTRVEDEQGRQWTLQHHGDFSGDVLVTLPADVRAQPVAGPDGVNAEQVAVPFEVMAELVGTQQIRARIAELEQRSGREHLAGA